MAVSPDYLRFVTELLRPLGGIVARPMMGGYCLYCDGDAFALIDDDALYLKADKVTRPVFEGVGLEPFRPFKDQPERTMSYFSPPAEFFDSRDAVVRWGQLAIDAGRRARAAKRTGTRAEAATPPAPRRAKAASRRAPRAAATRTTAPKAKPAAQGAKAGKARRRA